MPVYHLNNDSKSLAIEGGLEVHESIYAGSGVNYTKIDDNGNIAPVGTGGLNFGHIYVDGAQTIIVALSQNTPAEVKDDGTTSLDDGWLAGELNGTTFPTGGDEHYISVTKAGRYAVTWDMSFAQVAPAAAVEGHGGIAIDGTAKRYSGEAHRTLANGLDTGNMGATAIIDCPNGNEQISLWLMNTTNNGDMEVEHGNINAVLIGGT